MKTIFVITQREDDNNVARVVNAFDDLAEAKKEYPNNDIDDFPETYRYENDELLEEPEQYDITEVNLNEK